MLNNRVRGHTQVEETQNVPDFPYAQLAEMLELRGARISSVDQVVPALAADRAVIDAVHCAPDHIRCATTCDVRADQELPRRDHQKCREAAYVMWRSLTDVSGDAPGGLRKGCECAN